MLTDGINDGRGRDFGKCQLYVLLYGEMGKNFCPHLVQPFLKILIEGAVTTDAGSLFQYLMTLIEKADPHRRQWYGNVNLWLRLSHISLRYWCYGLKFWLERTANTP